MYSFSITELALLFAKSAAAGFLGLGAVVVIALAVVVRVRRYRRLRSGATG